MGTKKKLFKQKETTTTNEEESSKYSDSFAFGGSGGTEFEDPIIESEEIIGFTIYAGSSGYVDGIKALYSGKGTSQIHGSTKGTKNVFKCGPDEKITEIQIRSSDHVDAIKFKTTKKVSSWFGGSGGKESILKVDTIYGIKGRSDTCLNCIQFVLPYHSQNGNKNESILGEELLTAMNVKEFSDFKLTVNESETYYLHKMVLLQSNTLSELFKNGETEASLKVDHPKFLKELLEFLYSGMLTYKDENYMEMIELSNQFNILPLKLAGFDFIIKGKCNADNVCKLLMDAKGGKFKSVDPEDLVKRCMTFINENTEAVFKSEDFANLDHEFILAMVKNDELALDEIDIFNGCVRWAKKQRKNPSDSVSNYLQEIKPFIRFSNIDGADLVHHVKPTGMIDDSYYLRILEKQTAPEDYVLDPLPEEKGRGSSRFKFDINTGGFPTIWKLTNNGTTIEKVSAGGQWANGQIYGTKKLNSGVHYWEVKINSINSDKSGTAFGLCKNPSLKSQYSSDMVIGLSGYQYNMQGSDYTQFNTNDVYGCYVDFNKGKVWFFHNGKQLGSYGTVSKGTNYWPCFHIYYTPDKFTLSFPTKKPKPK